MTTLQNMVAYLVSKMTWRELREKSGFGDTTIYRCLIGNHKRPHRTTVDIFRRIYEREKRKERKGG